MYKNILDPMYIVTYCKKGITTSVTDGREHLLTKTVPDLHRLPQRLYAPDNPEMQAAQLDTLVTDSWRYSNLQGLLK